MFKYKATAGYKFEIQKLPIRSETEKTVTDIHKSWDGKYNRHKKVSSDIKWCDTWQEAHDFLRGETRQKVDKLTNQLKTAKEQEEYVNSMVEW